MRGIEVQRDGMSFGMISALALQFELTTDHASLMTYKMEYLSSERPDELGVVHQSIWFYQAFTVGVK